MGILLTEEGAVWVLVAILVGCGFILGWFFHSGTPPQMEVCPVCVGHELSCLPAANGTGYACEVKILRNEIIGGTERVG
jgi:hypothetical protein